MKGIIITGTIDQYLSWLREKKEKQDDWVYGSCRERVLGIRGKKLVLTGQYWLNEVYRSNEFIYLQQGNELYTPYSKEESNGNNM